MVFPGADLSSGPPKSSFNIITGFLTRRFPHIITHVLTCVRLNAEVAFTILPVAAAELIETAARARGGTDERIDGLPPYPFARSACRPDVRATDEIVTSGRLTVGSTVAAIADLDQQTLLAHAGQIATGDADIREITGPHYASLQGQGDRTVSQGRLWSSRKAYGLRAVPVAFALLRQHWRSAE